MKSCILVVDDNHIVQEVLADLLANKGHETKTCMNGKEAFQAMGKSEYSLAILDLNLPDIDGLELADHVEIYHPNTPIIFITGDYSKEAKLLKEECADRADRFFLQKPVTSEKLYEAVDSFLVSPSDSTALESC
ncbi:MAG: response regulator [Lentisphaeraceae bacterium]|nr:response regulator [Lentisphaeraceae bacterium]